MKQLKMGFLIKYCSSSSYKIEHEDESKIEVCISCDAASLTSFTSNGFKNTKDKDKKKKICKLQKSKKTQF